MEKSTLKQLGDTLRQRLPIEDIRGSKELRRLIIQLERRQRELTESATSRPRRKAIESAEHITLRHSRPDAVRPDTRASSPVTRRF
jgi:hypothetical protein